MLLKIASFSNERFMPGFVDEYKNTAKKMLNTVTEYNQKKLNEKNLGVLFSAHSLKDDKFVTIANIKLVENDLEYLFEQQKKHLIVTNILYDTKNNELYSLDHELNIPKLIQTNNPSRPILLFVDVKNTSKEEIEKLVETVENFFSESFVDEVKEYFIVKALQDIITNLGIKCLLIYDNNFIGNYNEKEYAHKFYSIKTIEI